MHRPFAGLVGRGLYARSTNSNLIIQRIILLTALLMNCQLIGAQTTTLAYQFCLWKTDGLNEVGVDERDDASEVGLGNNRCTILELVLNVAYWQVCPHSLISETLCYWHNILSLLPIGSSVKLASIRLSARQLFQRLTALSISGGMSPT